MLRNLVCIICMIAIGTQVQAQKYGHINLGNLLAQMPGVEKGSAELEQYQTKLVEALRLKVEDWEKRYKQLENSVNTLPPKEVKEKEAKLVEEQRTLVKEEQMISSKINERRNAIMGPIIKRVQAAIDGIGLQNGYTMIFDTSLPNTILFVDESEDLAPQVKAKLGIE